MFSNQSGLAENWQIFKVVLLFLSTYNCMLLFSYVISGFEICVVFSTESLEGNKYKFMILSPLMQYAMSMSLFMLK